jgi:hypothetical protein
MEDGADTTGAARNGVSARTMIIAVLMSSLLSVTAAVVITSTIVERGVAGPAGERGPRGREGPPGQTEVDPEAVWEVIESDDGRVTSLVEGNLSFAPAELEDDVETLKDDVEALQGRVQSLEFNSPRSATTCCSAMPSAGTSPPPASRAARCIPGPHIAHACAAHRPGPAR